MYITKTMLYNDILNADTELRREGYLTNDAREARLDLEDTIAKQIISRSDYDSKEDYQDAVNSYFSDGTERLCFVPRDSVLCTALMDFYGGTTVSQFEARARQHIFGYYSQMLTDVDQSEGFWFVAGSDLLDALVPYQHQKAFFEDINPNLPSAVAHSLGKSESDNLTELLDSIQQHLTDDGSDYQTALKQLKSSRNKLGL